MKLKDTFVVHESGDEQILVDRTASFAGLVRNNETAAFIVNLLREDTTEAAIADAVFERYDAPRAVIEKDVAAVLAKLRSVGAIDG